MYIISDYEIVVMYHGVIEFFISNKEGVLLADPDVLSTCRN